MSSAEEAMGEMPLDEADLDAYYGQDDGFES